MGYTMGMSKKATKQPRPDDQAIRVLNQTHERLRTLAHERKTWLGGLATDIIEAYLDQLAEGTDWLEVRKAGKGDG